MSEDQTTATDDKDMIWAYRQLHRMNQFFEAYADYSEAHDKLVSRLTDVNPLTAVHFSKKVIDGRELLELRIREDLAPFFRDLKRLIQMHEEESDQESQDANADNKPELGEDDE